MKLECEGGPLDGEMMEVPPFEVWEGRGMPKWPALQPDGTVTGWYEVTLSLLRGIRIEWRPEY